MNELKGLNCVSIKSYKRNGVEEQSDETMIIHNQNVFAYSELKFLAQYFIIYFIMDNCTVNFH